MQSTSKQMVDARNEQIISVVRAIQGNELLNTTQLSKKTHIPVNILKKLRFLKLIPRPVHGTPKNGAEQDILRLRDALISFLLENADKPMKTMALSLGVDVATLRGWIEYHDLGTLRPKKPATHQHSKIDANKIVGDACRSVLDKLKKVTESEPRQKDTADINVRSTRTVNVTKKDIANALVEEAPSVSLLEQAYDCLRRALQDGDPILITAASEAIKTLENDTCTQRFRY